MIFQARVWISNANDYWKPLTVHPGRITVTDEMWFARVDSFQPQFERTLFVLESVIEMGNVLSLVRSIFYLRLICGLDSQSGLYIPAWVRKPLDPVWL